MILVRLGIQVSYELSKPHPSDTWQSLVEHEGGALEINPTPAGEFEFASEYAPQLGYRHQYLASPGDDA
ncbi:hypothetical protein [Polaromonas sp.]|uniref:hypothetical protein n=1 Tax=Polaromonas sp. TaxID=1869339 RepID=UPI00352B30A0